MGSRWGKHPGVNVGGKRDPMRERGRKGFSRLRGQKGKMKGVAQVRKRDGRRIRRSRTLEGLQRKKRPWGEGEYFYLAGGVKNGTEEKKKKVIKKEGGKARRPTSNINEASRNRKRGNEGRRGKKSEGTSSHLRGAQRCRSSIKKSKF